MSRGGWNMYEWGEKKCDGVQGTSHVVTRDRHDVRKTNRNGHLKAERVVRLYPAFGRKGKDDTNRSDRAGCFTVCFDSSLIPVRTSS
eukprot:gene24145-biopygen9861